MTPPAVTPDMDRRLWEYRWFRDLAILIGVALVIVVAYTVRGILIPVVIGLAMAYAVDPLVSWAARRLHVPRLATALLIMLVGFVALTGLGIYVVPKLASQVADLAQKVPGYLEQAADKLDLDLKSELHRRMPWFGAEERPATQPAQVAGDTGTGALAATGAGDTMGSESARIEAAPGGGSESGGGSGGSFSGDSSGGGVAAATQPAGEAGLFRAFGREPEPGEFWKRVWELDFKQAGTFLTSSLGLGYSLVSSAISIGTYLVLALTITAICYVYFSWHFQSIVAWVTGLIPATHYDRTVDIFRKMDRSVSAWLRGRIIQVFIITVLLTTGWGVVGVPYWLLLGIVAGLLNLIPYMSVIGWPAAILLAWVDSLANNQPFSLWWVIIAPSAVYIIAQSIDGWVVEPLVQGKATNLDPVSVLLAVLVGGSLAGVAGMLIAIPAAACCKILAQELLLPRLRAQARAVPPGG